jgi:hypothetical protein
MKIWNIFFVGILLVGCKDDSNCLKSTGEIIKEQRILPYFSVIDIHDNIDLILSNDSLQKIEVEAGKNIIDNIKTEVVNYQLVIKNTNKCNWLRSYDKKIKVYVSQPALVELYNNSYGKISNIEQQLFDTLTIHNYGNGELNMNIKCHKLKFDSNFFGDINLYGEATDVLIHCFRLARLDTRYLKCQNMNITLDAEGDVFVNAENSIIGKITSKGNVYYYGNPPTTNFEDLGEGNFIKK